MEWIDRVTEKAIIGQVCLVQKRQKDSSHACLIRRLVKTEEKWLLQADNPRSAEEVNYGDIKPIARFVEVAKAEEQS